MLAGRLLLAPLRSSIGENLPILLESKARRQHLVRDEMKTATDRREMSKILNYRLWF